MVGLLFFICCKEVLMYDLCLLVIGEVECIVFVNDVGYRLEVSDYVVLVCRLVGNGNDLKFGFG